MAPATLPSTHSAVRHPPRLLIVDDEPDLLALLKEAIPAKIDCAMTTARGVAEARRFIERDGFELLITDLCLPDGDGTSLVSYLRYMQPSAASMVITGKASIEAAVHALRAGVVDFVPKPFTVDQIVERVDRAIQRQALIARNERRILRLKDAVRRLNQSRKMVSRKVDLLCNDLISAYGELARQMEEVRNQESFRKALDGSKDLEQMLCHAMDWILRHAGYCNLAVWLAAEDHDYQLGAYMKYTIPGEPAFTDAMKQNLVPMTARENLVHLEHYDLKKHLTPAELKTLAGQTILSINCTYLGESLAVMVLFRDEKCPFSNDDVAMLKAIGPVFATALAGMVRKHESAEEDGGHFGGLAEPDEDEKDRRRKRKKEQHDADWWKRGDPPPF